MIQPGPRNLITDVAGLKVGNAQDHAIKTGVTALVCDAPSVCGVHVMGGAPGTRETDLLAPHNTVEAVDALVLSGGSAFGLEAASGVHRHLAQAGRGFAVGPARVPIVPAAILFDLLNGGNKDWGGEPPYLSLGMQAAAAVGLDFSLGSAGAGTGALVAGLKGGLGSASAQLGPDGPMVGAVVAVNAMGSPLFGNGPHFRAAMHERDGEFGGLGMPDDMTGSDAIRLKFRDAGIDPNGASTTIGIVATDAALTKAQCTRLAVSAHDGLARALWPAHLPLDGDAVFAVSTGVRPVDAGDPYAFAELCAATAACMARAIARGVYLATPAPADPYPAWRTLFAKS